MKSQKDFVSGLTLIVVGIAFAVGATHYSFGSAARPGPGYFPFGLGIILALLGLVIFITSFFKHTKDGEPIGKIPWRSLCCIVGALVFFGYFLTRWGFIISFPLMIIITTLGSREFHWLDALLSAVVLTALSYLIFIYGLDLSIPLWPA